MKKVLKVILEFIIVMTLITVFTNVDMIFAAESLPIDPSADTIYRGGSIPTPPKGKTGQEIAKDLLFGGMGYVKAIVVAVGILYISILGFQLIQASGNEEEITKARKGIIYALISFVMISMAQDLGKIFDMEGSTLLQSPQEILKRFHLFDKQVEIFITFIKYVIGTFAVIMVISSAARLITAGGNDEEMGKHKKGILYSAGGLILIYVGDIFINKVFYKVDTNIYSGITGVHPGVDAKEGVAQITGIINFVVSFVGPIALLMLIMGAIMYAIAGGEDEKTQKAKRIITAAIVGIVIIYGAFALVSTVINSKLVSIGAMAE